MANTTPVQITPGTDITRFGQSAVMIDCSAAGDVVLKLPGGNLKVPVGVGASIIYDIEVIGVVVAGTTATAVVTVLR